jgi:hypothetical protein
MSNPYHPNPFDNLRRALQYLLDCEGEGWQLCHYAVALGLERMDSTGVVETTVWVTSPMDQADYITDGLLAAAEDMRAGAESVGDD